MSCDCKKIEKCLKELKKLVEEIHQITGFEEFPVETPASFYGDDNTTLKHENIPQILSWSSQQIDAVSGQFPAKISGLNQEGGKVDITIDNMAEGILELYGLMLKNSVDSDFAMRASMAAAAEAQAAKIASIVAQDYAVANADHLGYRGNPKRRAVKSSINVKGESPKDFLKPSKGEVIGWEFEDKGTIKEDLISLRSAGGIIRTVFARTAAQLTEAALRGLADKATRGSDFDAFLAELQDPSSPGNIGSPAPRVVDKTKTTTTEGGNNT